MISITKLRLFPRIIRNQALAIPNTDDKPYNLIVYTENMTFGEVYDKLQIKRIFIRKVFLILSPFLKLFRNKPLIDEYRNKGLMVVPNLDSVKRDNVYIDLSHVLEKIEKRYKAGNYRRKNVVTFVNNFFNQFTDNKERTNIFMYALNLHSDFPTNIYAKRIFPLLYELYQNKDFKFDYVVFTIFKDEKPYFITLKNPEGVIQFNRVRNVINSLKRIPDEEKPEDDINNAAESISNEIEPDEEMEEPKEEVNVDDKTEGADNVENKKEKIKSAIISYLKDKPELVEQIKNKSITKGDAYSIATKAIIKNTSTASHDQVNNTVEGVAKSDEEKRALLKKVTDNLVKDILKKNR